MRVIYWFEIHANDANIFPIAGTSYPYVEERYKSISKHKQAKRIIMIIIIATAILVSVILERQERRHIFMESLEYLRMGKGMPKPKPKLSQLECWLNIAVGTILIIIGLGTVLSHLMVVHKLPEYAMGYVRGALIEYGAIIAAGIVIIILGFKSIREHRRLSSEIKDIE